MVKMADTPAASSPRISRSTRHTGVQTDEAARSWTRAHSCFPGDQGYTPIVPFVVGADALKGLLRGIFAGGWGGMGGGGGGVT